MSKDNGFDGKAGVARGNSRVHCLREINVTYEGQNERTLVKAPDLSANGMFISTSRHFPEGAILNLQFRMAVTNAVVETRCEVRYCLPGVGVGVEFVGIAPEAKKDIERELKLALSDGGTKRRVTKRATARHPAKLKNPFPSSPA
ncbi:MAG: PilZ domain-containing protein [Candidatus Acidiferrales bacterium]